MQGHRIIAIDPGPEQSAYVTLVDDRVEIYGINDNEYVIQVARDYGCRLEFWRLAIEGVACFGMPVGAEVFATCVWIGRFMEAFGPEQTELVYRKDVKMHLCGSMRAKDPMIRQALIDRYGPGREKAIGTKKKPGPLYGVSSHCWSALAVAVTFADTRVLDIVGK